VNTALIGMPGLWEWLVIGGVLMLLFGARRIPEIARSLGSGVTEFKKGLRGEDDDAGKLPPPDKQPAGS
jgi:sec-independent protein translocase protein TatA